MLEDRNNIVLSKTFANKLFGTDNPVGQSITIGDSTSYLVSGIMEDIKNSTLPYADIIFRVERAHEYNWSISMDNPGNAGSTVPFLKMKPGADLRPKVPDILSYFKEMFWIYKQGMSKTVTLLPLNELYFSDLNEFGAVNSGNKRFVIVLLSVGILILIFAIFNYINLTVAQAGQPSQRNGNKASVGIVARRTIHASDGGIYLTDGYFFRGRVVAGSCCGSVCKQPVADTGRSGCYFHVSLGYCCYCSYLIDRCPFRDCCRPY